MFGLFKSKQEHIEELMDEIKESSETIAPPQPAVTRKDYYRVGWDGEMVTLTLVMDAGYSTTLSINQTECERMIRMLRAAYNENNTGCNHE
jgi:hypothetical protein